MTQEFINNQLYAAWPFWVLELETSADNREIEKAYAKLSGAIKLQLPRAEFYNSPLGNHSRDEFLLRDARSLLINPETRILAEFWYISPTAKIKNSETISEETKTSINWKKLLGTI